MKRNPDNICKFVQPSVSENITTVNFVYETKPDVLSQMKIKQENVMYLAVSGRGKLVTEEGKYSLTKGMIFFTFSGIHFKIENEDSFECMYITFFGERCNELFKRFGISKSNCAFSGNEGIISFWQNAIARANKNTLDLISEGVLLYSFSQLSPVEKTKEQTLTDSILAYIDANFTDSSLNLSNTSDVLGYNEKYISRVFKENVGMTFSNYLTHTRMQHAVFLMEHGITSVKNVALLSGYRDPLYFSNIFKKETGISASEYIKKKASGNGNCP